MKKNYATQGFLSASDIRHINAILSRGKHSVRVIKRAQILSALNKNYPAQLVANIVRTTKKTVYNTLKAYYNGGIDNAIYDNPRTGQPPVLNQKQNAHIIALACSKPPIGRSRWTVQLLLDVAKKTKIVMNVSKETIRSILENHTLKPWREKMWCVPRLDKEYIHRMEDVLALYEKPYDIRYPVVCIDEKPVQLLSETYKIIPAKPGRIKHRDHEYTREGIANVFCGVEPKTGKVVVRPTENRKANAFAKFFRAIIRKYKSAKMVHIVMDNLNTHKEKSLINAYGEKLGKKLWKKAIIHYTPKHASWLNQAEIAIGIYSRKCLGKDRIDSLSTLKKRTSQWKKRGEKIKIDWKFTRKRARAKFNY